MSVTDFTQFVGQIEETDLHTRITTIKLRNSIDEKQCNFWVLLEASMKR